MSKLISALCDTVSSRRCGKVKDSDGMIRMEPSLRVASKFRDFLDDTRTKYHAESTNVFLVHGDEDMADSIIEQASAYGIDPDEVDYRMVSSEEVEDSAASTREAVNQFYVDTFGESYDDSRPSPYGFWCDKFDVEALGKKWPNGDKSKSELLFIPSTNLDVVSFPETLSGDPESLMIVVQSMADALGLDYKYMFPGYYYVDSANNEIIYLRSIDQVKKWVASLEPLEGATPISGEEEDKMWDHLRKFRRSHNL